MHFYFLTYVKRKPDRQKQKTLIKEGFSPRFITSQECVKEQKVTPST